jgi:hypothetical protein
MQTRSCALLVLLAACGGDDSSTPDAAATAPPMITVSGTATKREGTSTNPGAGVKIEAFRKGESAAVAMTTTDAQGNYSLTLTTNGVALDGYLKGTLTGFVDTYLYPPKPLAENFDMASMNMINQSTIDLLSDTLCGSKQDAAKGAVAVIVADANRTAVAGAMVSSTPAAAKYCYNQGGFPNRNAVMTDADGIAYMLNVAPGNVSVSATKSGTTFASHSVEARAGVLTTTVIQP